MCIIFPYCIALNTLNLFGEGSSKDLVTIWITQEPSANLGWFGEHSPYVRQTFTEPSIYKPVIVYDISL